MADIQKTLFLSLKERARSKLVDNNHAAALDLYRQCESLVLSSDSQGFSPREKAIINLNISICYLNIQRQEEAEAYLQKSLENDRTYLKAYYRKACLLRDREKYDEALEVCQEALKVEKNQEIMILGVTKIHLA